MGIIRGLGGGGSVPSSLVDVLDATDPAALVGAEAVAFATECFRARNRATARFLTSLYEACRAVDGQRGRRALLDAFSGDEAAAALGWSRAMAGRWLDLAEDLLRRLPEVHAAMRTGDLEEAKARVFSAWTRDLADDHAHHICSLLLAEAPQLTVGALIERIEQTAIALDPEWAARRQANAQKRARVVASRNPSGTANLCGYDLPLDRSAVGMARLEALAATLRRRGVPVLVEALRAEVLLSLLDGTAAGLDDDTLLDLLATTLTTTDDGPGEPDDGPPPPDSGGPDDGPDGGPAPEGPGDRAAPGDEPVEPDDPRDTDTPGAPGEDPPPEPPARIDGVRDGTVEVRVRLTTALGLDELPAQVPRWGTVLAATARTMLHHHRRGEWRLVLTDDTGRLAHLLLVRGRPRPPGPRRAVRRGRAGPSIVELQVPTTVLAALDPDDHPTWAPLLRELRRRVSGLGTPGPPDQDVPPEDARHRRPSAEVDRWTRVRDRHCVAPSCRRPAHGTDLDHTRDHARGGPSLTRNLGAWCRHHHRAKHDGGWRVTQPEPGRFLITTRAGVTYETRPELIIEPLPPPRPASAPRPLPLHEQVHPDHTGDGPDDPRPSHALRDTGRPRPVDGPTAVPRPRRTTAQRDSLRRPRRAAPTREPDDPDPPPF